MVYGNSFQLGQSTCINISHITNVAAQAFSEQEILLLNDLLLTKGVHTITVKNISAGRHVLNLFITLLNQYHRIYWLSHEGTVPDQVADLYHLMHEHAYFKTNSIEKHESFLYEQFHADLLVIECTEQLLKERWYVSFEQLLSASGLCEHIPVIQIMYE